MRKLIAKVVLGVALAGCEVAGADPVSDVQTLLNIGDITNALATLESAIQSDPTNAELRALSLHAYMAGGDWDKAVEASQVLENIRNAPGRDFRHSLVLAHAGRWGELRAILDAWPISRIVELVDHEWGARDPEWAAVLTDAAGATGEMRDSILRPHQESRLAVQRDLGVGSFYMARAILSMSNPGPYDIGIEVAGPLIMAAEVDSLLTQSFAPVVRSYISDRPLPIQDRRLGEWHYHTEVVRHFGTHAQMAKAVGDYELALGYHDLAEAAWARAEANRGSVPRSSLENMVQLRSFYVADHLDLLGRLGRTSDIKARCSVLAGEFPEHVIASRFGACGSA